MLLARRGWRREESFRGATDLPNFFRKPYGPGWALALGICDAFRDVDLLVEAVDAGLSGRRDMADARQFFLAREKMLGQIPRSHEEHADALVRE